MMDTFSGLHLLQTNLKILKRNQGFTSQDNRFRNEHWSVTNSTATLLGDLNSKIYCLLLVWILNHGFCQSLVLTHIELSLMWIGQLSPNYIHTNSRKMISLFFQRSHAWDHSKSIIKRKALRSSKNGKNIFTEETLD